jgi:arsenate reductase-like glutaredoxin family protein
MNPKENIEATIQHLKAQGFTDETIALFLQQMDGAADFFVAQAARFNALYHNQKEEPEEDAILLHTETTLTPQQQWAVACGADMAFANGQYLNELTTGLAPKECRQLLSEFWDIDSTEEALEVIHWLFQEGHRTDFDILWQAVNMVSIKEAKEILRKYIVKDKNEEAVALHRLRNLHEALRVFKQHQLFDKDTLPNMLIWDYARIINLSRGCYDAGYITREEALSFIETAAGPIRKTYSSWRQLSISYQFAKYVWMGVDEDVFKQLLEGMNRLLTDANSPWVTLKWDDSHV